MEVENMMYGIIHFAFMRLLFLTLIIVLEILETKSQNVDKDAKFVQFISNDDICMYIVHIFNRALAYNTNIVLLSKISVRNEKLHAKYQKSPLQICCVPKEIAKANYN